MNDDWTYVTDSGDTVCTCERKCLGFLTLKGTVERLEDDTYRSTVAISDDRPNGNTETYEDTFHDEVCAKAYANKVMLDILVGHIACKIRWRPVTWAGNR